MFPGMRGVKQQKLIARVLKDRDNVIEILQ